MPPRLSCNILALATAVKHVARPERRNAEALRSFPIGCPNIRHGHYGRRLVVNKTPRLLRRLSAEGGALRFSEEEISNWLELALFPDPRSAGEARRALAAYCTQLRVPEELTEVGVLAMSELVTNVIIHAGTPALVLAEYDGANLTLAVSDGGDGLPVVMSPDSEWEHGRGVAIVEELGATWGIRRTYLGKIVWVNLARADILAGT
jgi:anti-sigma regulatory factor (Ser/Thr protein kinase)